MYRLRFSLNRDPGGPDGSGWNRLAIHPMEPMERCALRPRSRQAALDTLRGMAHFGNVCAYSPCSQSAADCRNCPTATHEREEWQASWLIREDSSGNPWLLANADLGFSAFGYRYRSWRALMHAVNVPTLRRQLDKHGAYWIAA